MNTKKYAPKLPLQLDKDGNFVKIDDFIQNCKQKLRMIILTNPGEKIMEPNFGVGIKRYLFESTSGIVTFNYINGTLDNVSAENIQETILLPTNTNNRNLIIKIIKNITNKNNSVDIVYANLLQKLLNNQKKSASTR